MGVWPDTASRLIDWVRRFDAWSRHAEARHPLRFSLVRTAVTVVVIFGSLFALNPGSGSGGSFVVALAAFGSVLAFGLVLQAFLWRPNGWGRRRYDAWVEREGAKQLAEGWYDDPTGRHRVRYMHRGKWTKWVADDSKASVDRGAMAADFRGKPITRLSRALPLLLGFVAGALLGASLIVVAVLFPHHDAWGIISADNTSAYGPAAWIFGIGVVVIAVAEALRHSRSELEVSPAGSGAGDAARFDQLRAFGHSFVPTLGAAALGAWATWIQQWILPWSHVLPFVALGILIGIAVVAGIFAAKVAGVERRGRPALRSRGLVPALRGAFVTAAD